MLLGMRENETEEQNL